MTLTGLMSLHDKFIKIWCYKSRYKWFQVPNIMFYKSHMTVAIVLRLHGCSLMQLYISTIYCSDYKTGIKLNCEISRIILLTNI